MNEQLFLFIINLILISRLALTFIDQGADRSAILKMALLPLVALLLIRIDTGWFVLLFYLLLYPLLMLYLERRAQNLYRNRTLLLLVHLILIGWITGPVFELDFNSVATVIQRNLEMLYGPVTVTHEQLLYAQTILFGLLMVLNEMNHLLRWLLQVFRLESVNVSPQEIDEQEFNTGRVIGLLERIFIFVFVLLNQFSAIGLILAAKGVTRFEKMKDRLFAEYVLIGTLLSTLLAMVMAMIVQWMW